MRKINIYLLVIFVLMACKQSTELIIPFSNSEIEYSGRIEFSKDESADIYWSGSSVKINFEGTSIQALLKDDVSEESFYSWGWRIPFLASAILIGISMYIQLNLEDTKAFKELQAMREGHEDSNQGVQRSPILKAIKKYPSRIALAAGAFLSIQVTFYILIAFLLAYGVSSAEISRDDMLAAVLIASAIMVPSQFIFSSYSDRHGRKGIFMAGAIFTGLWAFAIFPLVDTGNFWLIVLAITMGLIFVGMMYGPQAAFFTELFSTEVRYSGATLGYQFGAILGGAFAPTIAAFLWNNYGIFWVSVYIAFASLLTLFSVMALTETYQNNLSDE